MTTTSKRTVSQILDGLDNGNIVHDIHAGGFVEIKFPCVKCGHETEWQTTKYYELSGKLCDKCGVRTDTINNVLGAIVTVALVTTVVATIVQWIALRDRNQNET